MQFVNQHNTIIEIGKKLGGGGEGIVYTLPFNPSHVAKVYHDRADKEKKEKIIYMCNMSKRYSLDRLFTFTAWPQDILFDKETGDIWGFTMKNLIYTVPIHQIYSPIDRKYKFPNRDWSFLVHVSRNIAAAFATIHQHNMVIGDVNQDSIRVSKDGTVNIIDCDSFQIPHKNGIFRCKVAQREFTPPELHGGIDLHNIIRTPNHDNFCLAILIFLLLLMGRHPFSGRNLGNKDISIPKAIENYMYVYSHKAHENLLPPHTNITPSILSPELIKNFEHAFEKSSYSKKRPEATLWLEDISSFQRHIRACNYVSTHKYFNGLNNCPWCESLKDGNDYFPQIHKIMPINGNDIASNDNKNDNEKLEGLFLLIYSCIIFLGLLLLIQNLN